MPATAQVSSLARTPYHVLTGGLAILFLFPLLWCTYASVSPQAFTGQTNGFGFGNYTTLFKFGIGLGGFVFNSAVISILTVAITLIISTLGGYAFARFKFWGRDFIFLVTLSILMVPYDPPYSGPRVEANGYGKIKDVFSYNYDVQNAPETIGKKLMARAGVTEGRIKVRTANMKMFDAEVRTIVGIFNDAWSDNWGFVPFTQAEIDHAAKAFGPVIVPELAVFVEVDDEAVAFIVALANLNEAIADFNGRLNPINLVKLLWRLKVAGPESTRVPLMGVKKKYRNHPLMGAGLAMMAIDQLRQNGKRLGKKTAELGWILEDNKATNNIIRSVGGVLYKTHRIYEKALG